jgi:hypothetical protein
MVFSALQILYWKSRWFRLTPRVRVASGCRTLTLFKGAIFLQVGVAELSWATIFFCRMRECDYARFSRSQKIRLCVVLVLGRQFFAVARRDFAELFDGLGNRQQGRIYFLAGGVAAEAEAQAAASFRSRETNSS